MKKITNKEAKFYVDNLEPFKASNLSAEWIGQVYVVSSYAWYPVFVHKNGKWFENYATYSRSTARQMATVRPSHVHEKLNPLALNQLIKE